MAERAGMTFWDWVLGRKGPGGELPLESRMCVPLLPADRRGVPFPRRIRQAVLLFHELGSGPRPSRAEAEQLLQARLPYLSGRAASDFKLLVTAAEVASLLTEGDDSTLGNALLRGLKEDPENVHAELAQVGLYLVARKPIARPPPSTLEYWKRDIEDVGTRATICLIGDLELVLLKLRMVYGSID